MPTWHALHAEALARSCLDPVQQIFLVRIRLCSEHGIFLVITISVLMMFVDGRATLVMCPVSLAGQWIEQAELTWGEGLRIHQALPRLCCWRHEMASVAAGVHVPQEVCMRESSLALADHLSPVCT